MDIPPLDIPPQSLEEDQERVKSGSRSAKSGRFRSRSIRLKKSPKYPSLIKGPESPSGDKGSRSSWGRFMEGVAPLFEGLSPRSPKKQASSLGVVWAQNVTKADDLLNLTPEQVASLSLDQLSELMVANFEDSDQSKIHVLEGRQLVFLNRDQWSLVLPGVSPQAFDEVLERLSPDKRDQLVELMSKDVRDNWLGRLRNVNSDRFRRRLSKAPDFKVMMAAKHYWELNGDDLRAAWVGLSDRLKIRKYLLAEFDEDKILCVASNLNRIEAIAALDRMPTVSSRRSLIAEIDPLVRLEMQALIESPQAAASAPAASVIVAIEEGGVWHDDRNAFRGALSGSRILYCPRDKVTQATLSSERIARFCEHFNDGQWRDVMLCLPVSRLDDLRRMGYITPLVETRVLALMTAPEFDQISSSKKIAQRMTDDWRSLQQLSCYHQMMKEVRQMNQRIDILEKTLAAALAPIQRPGDELTVPEDLSNG